MVNNRNLSAYKASDPTGEATYIPNGPLYPPQDVLLMLGSAEVRPITRKCREQIRQHGYDQDDLKALVRKAVVTNGYRNSRWCAQGAPGCWYACDGYRVTSQEWVEKLGKYFDFVMYIKFAVHENGSVLVLISCHDDDM